MGDNTPVTASYVFILVLVYEINNENEIYHGGQ